MNENNNDMEYNLIDLANKSLKNWVPLLVELEKFYFQQLNSFLSSEYELKDICPKFSNIFRAYELTPLKNVKVVILGQDPYHTKDVADGLAFSCGDKIQPSLKNIFEEINRSVISTVKMSDVYKNDDSQIIMDYESLDKKKDEYILRNAKIKSISNATNGRLDSWAKQGVLLLNTVLTVVSGDANSHKNKGWEHFVKKTIDVLNENNKNVIYLLWGDKAKAYEKYIDTKNNFVLKAIHPSPLSNNKAKDGDKFIGCGHFKNVNEILTSFNKDIIDWSYNV